MSGDILDWRDLISDFNGLVTSLVQRLSRHKVAAALSHDKKTIVGWLSGAQPSNSRDVAWLINLALKNGIDISPFQSYSPIYNLSPLSGYEENISKDPIDLTWLTSTRPPPAIKTSFGRLELDGPLGVASSPLIADDRWAALMLELGFGLSTFKTKRNSSKPAWFAPHIAFVPEAPDLSRYDPNQPIQVPVTFNQREITDLVPNIVNSIGVPSESPSLWQETFERIKSHPRGRFVGISIMGEGRSTKELVKDFETATQRAKDLDPPFIELNLSCPNLGEVSYLAADPSMTERICSRAAKILKGTNILLVIKVPSLPHSSIHAVLRQAGRFVHAVAYQNSVRVEPVARDRDGKVHGAFLGRRFGGLSGPCTFPMTRRGIRELVKIREELGQSFRIIAIGGVATPGNVVELMDAGADIVQACTAPMFDPLLAWKTRFHLKQFEQHMPSEKALHLKQPRNQSEIDSLMSAVAAYGEIQTRYPGRIPYETFVQKWNIWMEQRPNAPAGKAHRLSATRKAVDWVRDFTS